MVEPLPQETGVRGPTFLLPAEPRTPSPDVGTPQPPPANPDIARMAKEYDSAVSAPVVCQVRFCRVALV